MRFMWRDDYMIEICAAATACLISVPKTQIEASYNSKHKTNSDRDGKMTFAQLRWRLEKDQ